MTELIVKTPTAHVTVSLEPGVWGFVRQNMLVIPLAKSGIELLQNYFGKNLRLTASLEGDDYQRFIMLTVISSGTVRELMAKLHSFEYQWFSEHRGASKWIIFDVDPEP